MCPKCKDYMGRCGECGADLTKGTRSTPISRPMVPPRPRPSDEGDNPEKEPKR